MGCFNLKIKGFYTCVFLLFLALVITESVKAQVYVEQEALKADYNSLRDQFEGNYRDSVYIDRLLKLTDIAQEQSWDDVLLNIGLENWATLNTVGFYSYVIDDIEYIKASEQINLSESQQNNVNLYLLEAYSTTRETVKGIAIANEIIDNSDDEKAIAPARGFLSTLYSNAARFNESAELLFKNLVYFEAVKDTSSQIATLNNLAQINEALYNFKLALDLFKQAESLAIKSGDLERELLVLSSLGVYFKNSEDFENATNYYLRAIELSESIDDLSAYAQNNFNLGNIYYEQGQFSLASDRYDIAYKIVQKLNYKYPLALIGIMRGTLLMDLNALSSAEAYLLEAEQIMSDVEDLETTIFLDEKLSLLYEKKKDYERALSYSKAVVENQQVVFEQGSLDSLNKQLINYQLKQAELLSENQRIETKRSQQNNILFSILIFVFGVGFVITSFMNQQKKTLIEKLFANAKSEFTKPLESLDQEENVPTDFISLDIFKVELSKTKQSGNRQELFYELFDIVVKKELFKSPDLGLNQLAKKVKSNTAYVSEAINTNLDMGFNAFINRIRTKKAQYLLLNTEMIIDDVMEECGYRNRSTFYRAFQNETGLTPGEYVQKRT